jgi:hypothetical protein
MLEDKIPVEPTREQEIGYLKWLEKSTREDPWLTLHPKLHANSPYRLEVKTKMVYRKEYRKKFYLNFALTTIIAWPVIT